MTSKPTFKEVVELSEFGPIRQWRAIVSEARKGKFAKNVGYTGWSKRALFEQAWFDAKTERTAANLLDEANVIVMRASPHQRPPDPLALRRLLVQPSWRSTRRTSTGLSRSRATKT